jgi:small-conductance mechanosensitive channel
MIDASFTEHGVVIAFPQRDVHLDAAAPIPVRVVNEPPAAPPPPLPS